MRRGDGIRNGTSAVSAGLSLRCLSIRYVPSSQANLSLSVSCRRLRRRLPPHNHFYTHPPFLLVMNILSWTLTLFLAALTSHAIRVPISRFKLHESPPLEKRARGHGGVSYNVFATGESSKDLELVGYSCPSTHILTRLRNKQHQRFDLHG